MKSDMLATSLRPVGGDPPLFVTTRWSVVLAAGEGLAAGVPDSPHASDALSLLCQTYWYPLYAFVRRKGHGPEEAEDLTQSFFERLLEKNYVAQADRTRGRFRTFLLSALQHFLADEWDKGRRQKRGGGQAAESFDTLRAEERYRTEALDSMDPARLYERRWVTTLLERVLNRLEAEYHEAGKAPLFQVLQGWLVSENPDATYAEVAASFNLTEPNLRQIVHRLRRRYRELFRDEIAQTVSAQDDLEDEMRHLLAML